MFYSAAYVSLVAMVDDYILRKSFGSTPLFGGARTRHSLEEGIISNVSVILDEEHPTSGNVCLSLRPWVELEGASPMLFSLGPEP